MPDKTKRSSLYKILVIRIIAVLILFNVVQALISIYETVQIQKEKMDDRRHTIKDEILNISEYLESAIASIQETFYRIQFNATQQLISRSTKQDLKKLDLNKELVQLGLNPRFNDLYVIENGTIVNTTYEKDLGLNFYDFGDTHKDKLNGILNDGEFLLDKFEFETTTKNLRSYSYQSTPDKKYIVEMGSSSQTVNNIMNMFKSRLKKIVYKHEDILSANIWFGEEVIHGLVKDSILSNEEDVVRLVMSSQADTSLAFRLNERDLEAEYLCIQVQYHKHFYDHFVVSIITDVTDKNIPVYNIIKKQVLYAVGILFLLIFVLIIATRDLKLIVREMIMKTTAIAKGNLGVRVSVRGENEFTTLAEHFNGMVDKLQQSYNDLNAQNEIIKENNEELQSQNHEIELQRDSLARQAGEITDSILYAQRIQNAVLPRENDLKELFSDHFIFFKPRDIVSGDFYWMKRIKNYIAIVTADCTGHGVPGAFMSMLGMSFLNELVTKQRLDNSGEILNRLRNKVKQSLHQSGKDHEQKDGMDLTFCMINTENMQMQYSGAYNPLYIVRGDEVIQYKADRQPIAIYVREKDFTTHNIQLEKNDVIYTFSDGFPDQIGGPEDRKYMTKNFRELLVQNAKLPMQEQHDILESELKRWRGSNSQMDDILVIGIRV